MSSTAPPTQPVVQPPAAPAPAEAAPSTSDARRHTAPLRWQSWPPRDEPRATLVLIAAIATVAALVASATGSLLWGVAAVVLLGATSARHWTRTVYEANREGLRIETRRGARRIRWTAVDRWHEGRDGVWLVTPQRPLPWDHLGGIFCPWPADRAELRRILRAAVGEPVGAGPKSPTR